MIVNYQIQELFKNIELLYLYLYNYNLLNNKYISELLCANPKLLSAHFKLHISFFVIYHLNFKIFLPNS